MVYAPLTRCRALGTVPSAAARKYYSQRTVKGGILLTEATCINDKGHGYPDTPGLYKDEQLTAWKPVVNAVHKAGGIFFAQLWHVGRASHPAYQPDGSEPVGPSAVAIPAEQKCMLPDGSMIAYPVPRPLSKEEIQSIVQDYATAAHNAIEITGFDGVEVHAANGYLIEQFFRKTANSRTDEYGGSIPNRCRFCLEVMKAVIAKVGADRVGIRLSPYGTYLEDGLDNDGDELTHHLIAELAKLKLLYLHCIEPRASGHQDVEPPPGQSLLPFRKAWPGPFLSAGGFTKELGDEAIKDGSTDLVTFGRWWLSNPDLPERFVKGAPLNKYIRETFYSPDPVVGYTDYKYLDQIEPGTPTRTHYSGMKIFV